jgi:uncharacterized protein (TIGR03437 family)
MSFLNARSTALFVLLLGGSISGFSQIYSNHYALILKDPPVTAQFSGREAVRSTAAESYRQHLVSMHDAVRQEAAARSIPVLGTADVVMNAVFVAAGPERVAEMQQIPGVLAVIPMRIVRPMLNRATALQNAPAAWTALGGQGNAGAGMKVGVIDYGIDQTHPAFQDPSLSMPKGFPICTDGHPEDCAYTNNKVIVARSYVRLTAAGSNPNNPAADSRPDDYSPRDREGHGTAIASVIAANAGKGVVTITGMAPKAWLGNYKVFGSPNVNDYPSEAIFIQALNDAVKDGMDVVNISSGITATSAATDTGAACGLAAGAPCDPLGQAVENAVKAGLVVVVAAGNNGYDGVEYPAFNTISTPGGAPSAIAVGAVTNSHYFNPTVSVAGAPSNLQNIAGQPGDDPYSPVGAYAAPVIDVTVTGDDGYGCGAFPAGSLSGGFALIQRSVVNSANACSFATKVDNAFDAGAAGVILYMSDSSAPVAPGNLDQNGIPVVMIGQSDGQTLKTYVKANPTGVATIDPSGQEVDNTPNGNLLSYYSSLGPSTGDSTIKPDLVAVGTDIYMAAQNYDPAGGQYSSTRYADAAGTSFASPMVAAAAALVKQKNPTWTPFDIRSAIINSASQDVKTDDGQASGSTDLVDVQWIGAGKLDAGAAVSATVVANPATVSWGILAAAPSNVAKQITITNKGTASVALTAAVVPGGKSSSGNLTAGLTPTLDKTSLTLAAGAAATLTLTLNGTLPASGSYSGALTVKGTGVSMTIPYLYLVGGGAVSGYNLVFVGSGGFEGIVGQQPVDPLYPLRPHSVGVKMTDASGVPVVGSSVSWSVRPRGAVTFQNSATVTDAYGIAATDVTIQQTGNITVTATLGGQTFTFSGYGWNQPTISSGGVVNDGNFQTPIAPGSYVAVFGTALSAYTDSATTTTLPLSIDGVNVSFDVPSAKLSYPGRLVFVSPGQINVQVPWELQGQTSAQVKVIIDQAVYGNLVTVPLADTAPAFFENNGIAAALDQNYAIVTTGNPAKRGQLVQLYMNALGPLDNQPNSGDPAPASPLATTKNAPKVTIGGQDAPVQFSGLAPGFPGLYQVNVTVPSGISAGTVPISLSIGGATTKASTLPVQ